MKTTFPISKTEIKSPFELCHLLAAASAGNYLTRTSYGSEAWQLMPLRNALPVTLAMSSGECPRIEADSNNWRRRLHTEMYTNFVHIFLTGLDFGCLVSVVSCLDSEVKNLTGWKFSGNAVIESYGKPSIWPCTGKIVLTTMDLSICGEFTLVDFDK